MKVSLVVLNNFKNDSRVLKEAKSLKKNGFEVNVLALHEDPLKENENIEGIPVFRMKLKTRNWSKHKVVQIIKYFEFIIKALRFCKKSKFIHCNDLNALPLGVIVKIFFNRKVKIIYDAHEYETEVQGLSGMRKKMVKFLEKKLIKYADEVITVSDGIANEYKRIYNIEKPSLVLNTPPLKNKADKDLFREYFNIKKEQKIFLYQGGFSRNRGIEIILESFKILSEIKQENFPVVIFMGYGVLGELIEKTTKEFDNMFFYPAVSPDILHDYTSSADYGILFYENTCLNHYYCSPNKMFEYSMAELPVIVSNLYEMKRLVEANNIGIVAEDNTKKGLVNAIFNILKLDEINLINNVKSIKSKYNWEEQEKVLINLYEKGSEHSI